MNMLPKEFIKIHFLEQYQGILNKNYHYLLFILIGMGIEFLGKCLDENATWQQNGHSETHFNNAINQLMPPNYIQLNNQFNLYNSLRCGMVHAFSPKQKIGLSHKEEANKFGNYHLKINNDGTLILIIEDLYNDFRNACEIILDKKFVENNKMNKPFLQIP